MFVSLLTLGAVAVLLIFWPQQMADVVDRIIAVIEEVWDWICEGLDAPHDSRN